MQGLAKLKKRREELRMTQKEFARHVGVEPITVYRWEKGTSIPRPQTWPKLKEVTGLSFAEILASRGAE